jgi:hypothetical protein
MMGVRKRERGRRRTLKAVRQKSGGWSDVGENDAAAVDDSIEMGRALLGGKTPFILNSIGTQTTRTLIYFPTTNMFLQIYGRPMALELTEQIASKQCNVPTIL